MKSSNLDKQHSHINSKWSLFSRNSFKIWLVLGLMLIFWSLNTEARKKYDEEAYFKLEAEVETLIDSPVTNVAPLEIKFIKEKMVEAKNAKAERDRKLETQLIAQIRAEMEIANLRYEVNQLNDDLLEKRDQLSAAQVYLLDLKEQLR